MTKHWIGHSLTKHIDVDELFNRSVVIRELESSLNNDGEIGASVVVEDKIEALVASKIVQ